MGAVSPDPMVRLVVLNHDGGPLLTRCLASLVALDWPADRLEVVVVDNASTDGSADAALRAVAPGGGTGGPAVRLLRSPVNIGFPANNLALGDLDGIDFVGLVNNDAFAEPGYLRALVDALARSDHGPGGRIAAACPKVLLAPRFRTVTVTGPTAGGWSLREVRVDGADVTRSVVLGDSWAEPGTGRDVAHAHRSLGWEAELLVPAGPDPIAVEVAVAPPGRDGAASWQAASVTGPLVDVVNSVGGELLVGGWGRDRGYLAVDRGQFDEPVEVFAWSGAGVLLRPEYLADVGLFEESFFLYYEDTDLAWRGRSRGWTYVTAPAAVLRHEHAASSGEGSPRMRYYVERNRLAMLARNAPTGLAATAPFRHLLSTASYARRDVVAPLARRQRPDLTVVRSRLTALAGFVRLLPGLVRARRALRRRATVPAATILLSWQRRPGSS